MFDSVKKFVKLLFLPETICVKVPKEDVSSGKAKLRLNFGPVIFIVTVLLLLQFFATALSSFHLSFLQLFLVSLLVSLVLVYLLIRKENFVFYITKVQLLVSLILVFISTGLFAIRVNWAYWDGSCPTYLLGLVTQVANGRFPVSFISFPEFSANYHQGFIYLAGLFSFLTKIVPAASIVIVSVTLFFFIVLVLQFLFVRLNSRYYYLPVILFTFITSCSLPWLSEFGLYNYLGAFEYVVSNSWPLALLLLVTLFWYLLNDQNIFTYKKMFGLAMLVLAASTANATVYSLLLLVTIILVTSYFVYHFVFVKDTSLKDKNIIGKLIWLLILTAAIYLLPKFIPSVFLQGWQYDQPHLAFRFNSLKNLALSLGTVMYHLRLSGTLSILGALLAVVVLKNRNTRLLYKVLSLILLISFTFPIVWQFTNVDTWDNLHKFAIVNMFVSVLLVVIVLGNTSSNLVRKFLWAGIIVSLLLSIPANYDMYKIRTSFDFNKPKQVSARVADITGHLQKLSKDTVLIPFGNNDLCGQDDFGNIGAAVGIFVRGSYFKNFLLSENVERDYAAGINWWSDTQVFGQRLNGLNTNEYIIYKNSDKELFLKQIDSYNRTVSSTQRIKTGTINQFSNFSLYHK